MESYVINVESVASSLGADPFITLITFITYPPYISKNAWASTSENAGAKAKGRPPERWFACTKETKETKEVTHQERPFLRLIRFFRPPATEQSMGKYLSRVR